MDPLPVNKPEDRRCRRLTGGFLLIWIGAALLLTHWLDIGSVLVLLIGVGLLLWGTLIRRVGWIIPGGVLSGIGLGILIDQGPWNIPSLNHNGLFLLCFALGWFLICVLASLVTARILWWPLIPGGIMAIVGSLVLLTGDPRIWQDRADLLTASILILIGVGLILRGSRTRQG